MLTNKSFIKWANENVVVLISHNELGHDEVVDEKVTGKDNRSCPLYPGLSCRQHLDIAVETDNSRDDELPVIPFVELCPNSWLIRPDGKVEAIEEQAQFTAKGIRDDVAKVQKALGEALPVKAYAALELQAQAALSALEEDAWRKGLEALAKLRAGVEKPGQGLLGWIDRRLEYVEEEVAYLFDEALEDADLGPARRRAAVHALFGTVDVKIGAAYVPVRERMAKWLAAHPEVSGK